MHNAGNEKQVNEQQKKAKTERDQEIEDIKTILDLPAGIRFFIRFMKDAHMFHTSMTGNSHTFFREGERNLGLKYFKDIVIADPEKLTEIMIKQEDTKND